MEVGQRVGEDDARAFLRSLSQLRPALGGQLLVGDLAAGWLLSPPEAWLERPDRIEWRADRRYREGSRDFPFMPLELRRPHAAVHVFMRMPDAKDFAYAGEARVTGYGYTFRKLHGEVTLRLHTKLDWETWLLLGGRPGFSIAGVGDGLDLGQAAQAVADRLATGEDTLCITDYSDACLTILINGQRAFVMVQRDEDDPGLVAGDPAAVDDTAPEKFTLDNGQVDEFDRRQTVTHEQAMSCVRSFLRDHTLGGEVRWLT